MSDTTKAYRDGLRDKDYTWVDGFHDAIFKWGGSRNEEEEKAFEEGKKEREKIDLQRELDEEDDD